MFNPNVPFPQPIIFFDSYAATTVATSQEISRSRPAGDIAPGMRYPSNLVVEAFPTSPGTATVQVVDAAGPGSLTKCTDSNGLRSSISAYSKFLVKGLMERVAIQLTVISGAWSVWGTFIEQPSDRAQYYDRNSINRTQSSLQQAIAPHAATVRWTYTVPAGKKAFAEFLYTEVLRNTAAGTPGVAAGFIQYTPSGGSTITLLQALISTNGVFDFRDEVGTQFGLMLAGDVLTGGDQDGSTGGTVTFVANAKIQEFDW